MIGMSGTDTEEESRNDYADNENDSETIQTKWLPNQ